MLHLIMKAIAQEKKLCKNAGGNTAVEFALLFPIFVILTLGVIEYGIWFFETEITTNSVANISQAIQNNPAIKPAQLQQLVDKANDGFKRLSFYDPTTNATSKNYICVKPYTTTALAQAGGCAKGDLSATNPNPGTPYAVAIDAFVATNPLTPLGNFIHALAPSKIGMTQNTVANIGNILPANSCVNTAKTWAVMQYDPTATPPYSCFQIPIPSTASCNTPGDVLQYSGGPNGTYKCVSVTPPPNCHQPWQNLEWNATTATWSCPNVPYVFAGGIAHASTTNAAAFWATGVTSPTIEEDGSYVKWTIDAYGVAGPSNFAPMIRNDLCVQIKFTVPAGLPAGQIIAQGNLIYPLANGGDGKWKHWTVAFSRLDTGPTPPTTSAYNGSSYLCMDNGGNYNPNDTDPIIDSEHQSWTIIFIPN